MGHGVMASWQGSGIRRQLKEGGRRSEIGGRKSEVRSRRAEYRGKKAEVGNQRVGDSWQQIRIFS